MSARRRRRAGHEPPLSIKGFADAVSVAMGMADRFERGHGVAVTDRRGFMLEMLMFTDGEHTADDAIRAGIHLRAHYPLARRVILVSALDDVDLQIPSELDVEMWRSAVDRFAAAGLELWEWILLSNELIRSLSMTADTEAEWRSSA
jgi:hypothetical protein